MATAKVEIVDLSEVQIISDLYSQIFRPARGPDWIRRRYMGRFNGLMMVAFLDERPVGFFLGFELKPTVYFAWLYGVVADCRRMGVASQLMDAVHDWVAAKGYTAIRLECQNGHRPMLHMAIKRDYDVVGIRWDPDRHANLVIFEQALEHEEEE